MPRLLITPSAVVTMDPMRRFIHDGGLVVNGNRIEQVLTKEELAVRLPFDGDMVSAPGLVAVPGFIQTHIHLCQTLFRGLADDLQLLDWLRLRIFPYEAAHTAASMSASAHAGIVELIRSGTTTVMDMGSVHFEEEIIGAVEESGLRAYVGKCMIDRNTLHSALKEATSDALGSTRALAEEWHGAAGDRIRYAVAPRFVLSCSKSLLREAYEMTRSMPGLLFHTHAAENRVEMDEVRKLCGMGNVEYFDSIDVLHENSCLAHCIWVNEREMNLLRDQKGKVLHCPSSNLKLGSGIAKVPDFLSRGISVSLGADGAPCNNTLDVFAEMRLAALIQKPAYGASGITAEQVFTMATVGGAIALGCEAELGSIEAGKKADLVLLDLGKVWNRYDEISAENIYSTVVYSCSPANVHSVMVDGQWLLKNFALTRTEEEERARTAREELRRLLHRV